METWFTPTGDDNPGNHRNQSYIRKPSLPLQRHQIGEDRGEKGRRGSDRLVKGHGQEAEGNVAEDDRHAEHEAEGRDFEELDPGSNGLHRDHLHPRDGDVAEQGASGHVAHGEEDRVLEPIIAEQILIEQEDADVGRVPRGNEPDREESAGGFHRAEEDVVVVVGGENPLIVGGPGFG